MTIETITQIPTKLVVRPDPANVENTGYSVRSAASKADASQAIGKNAEAEYSFWDFLDLINPLQHIPVVSSIYREITGDTIKPELKLAGGAVLGGPLGFITSLADVIFEQETGKDIGSTMMASAFGDDTKDAPVQLAKVDTTTTEETAALSLAPLPASLPPIHGAKRNDERDARAERLAGIDPMDQHILELYGKSNPAAASKAYQQADMRAYLQQASFSKAY
jgi:hypothetical protein